MNLFGRRLIRVMPIVVAGGLLWLVVPMQELSRAFRGISVLDILALSALSVALIGVSAIKWRAFLGQLHLERKLTELFSLYLVGYFVNTFSPSFIGGDVVRSMMVGKSVDRARTLAATFLERYTGILSMLLMAVCACFGGAVVTPQILLLVMVATFALIAGSIVVSKGAHIFLAKILRVPERLLCSMEIFQTGLRMGFGNKRLFGQALLLSLVFHGLTIVNTAVVASAVGWSNYTWMGLATVVPLILIVGAFPITPQGLGIQEGAFVYFLSQLGATPAQALAVAMVLRAKSLVLAVIGWLVVLRRPELHRRSE